MLVWTLKMWVDLVYNIPTVCKTWGSTFHVSPT